MSTLQRLEIDFSQEGLSGIELFNQGLYWEAHEAWETVWHTKKGRENAYYQGMIHVAAALLKICRDQFEGAHSQLTRAMARFQVAGPLATGTNDEEFRTAARACREELLRLGPEHLNTFDRSLFPVIRLNT